MKKIRSCVCGSVFFEFEKNECHTKHFKSCKNTRYGRSDRIRTCGILLPKQARYQLRYTPKIHNSIITDLYYKVYIACFQTTKYVIFQKYLTISLNILIIRCFTSKFTKLRKIIINSAVLLDKSLIFK